MKKHTPGLLLKCLVGENKGRLAEVQEGSTPEILKIKINSDLVEKIQEMPESEFRFMKQGDIIKNNSIYIGTPRRLAIIQDPPYEGKLVRIKWLDEQEIDLVHFKSGWHFIEAGERIYSQREKDESWGSLDSKRIMENLKKTDAEDKENLLKELRNEGFLVSKTKDTWKVDFYVQGNWREIYNWFQKEKKENERSKKPIDKKELAEAIGKAKSLLVKLPEC